MTERRRSASQEPVDLMAVTTEADGAAWRQTESREETQRPTWKHNRPHSSLHDKVGADEARTAKGELRGSRTQTRSNKTPEKKRGAEEEPIYLIRVLGN